MVQKFYFTATYMWQKEAFMKAKHYSSAKLLYGSTAYCDQWEKIMAIYDDNKVLRGVIIENDDSYGVTVLLIGEDSHEVYNIDGIEFGTTAKNMKACFDIYYSLRDCDIPKYRPGFWKEKYIEVADILTHTSAGAARHGGFHTIIDAEDEISKAMEIATPILESSDSIELWNEYSGDLPCRMHRVGDGAWCDDDGDNWDFD